MRIGIIQTSLDPADPARSFEMAAAAGADGIELACMGQDDAGLLGDEGARRVIELKQRHGLEVPSLALRVLVQDESLFGDEDVAAAAEDLIRRAMSAADTIGASVVLLPFAGRAIIETEDELDRAIARLGDLAEEAEAAGVTLGIESNLNVNQQLYMLENVAQYPSVKIYFDTGDILARKWDPATFLRELGNRNVCQVHLKDVLLGGEGRPPDFDVAPGDGDVDLPAVARALDAIGFDGWVVLETPTGDDPAAAAKTNIHFARELFA